MKGKLVIFARLIFGFILCSSSTVFMLNSNLGLSPWDVFHQGISNVTGITIGEASILTSVLVVLIGIMLKQKQKITCMKRMVYQQNVMYQLMKC